MASTDLSFGKIASTPTNIAWSQAYNAGGLFVILSLSLKDPEKDHESLAIIGKKFLNDLEAEFFSLEEKSTEGIDKVLEKVVSEVPLSLDLSTVVAFNKESTLYLFLVGNGSIIIKRGSELGTILSQSQATERTIKSASGFLTSQDTLLLSSLAFKKAVNDEVIKKALSQDDLTEAVETLTPFVHQAEDAASVALIFRSKESPPEPVVAKEPEEKAQEKSQDLPPEEVFPTQDNPVLPTSEALEPPMPQARIEKTSRSLPLSLSSLSHRRKVILSVAGILVIVLGLCIFFAISNQSASDRRELFDSIYPEALENYEKAEGLMDLNEPLAREELEKAKNLLSQTEDKFPQNTDEYKKTKELEDKVDGLLAQVGDAEAVEAKEISADESVILSTIKSQDAIAAIEDDTSVYFLTKDEIGSVRRASKSEQSLVENDGIWENAVGIGKFGSNFYVLDTKNGVIKLVPSGTDYNDSEYFVDDVSVADSTSMAIDSSVYILYKNGEVKKFTRGKEDDFSISGLENALKNPTQILTSEDIDNLYILDPQTARIVRVKKDGSFSKQYQTKVLQDAEAIAVSEDESKAYILSGGKIYEISL